MPINVNWYIEDQVIQFKPYGVVTIGDVLEIDEIVTSMMSISQSSYVHILCDLSDVITLPNPSEFKLGQGDTWVRHPKCGWFLTVATPNPTIRMTMSVVLQKFNIKSRSFDTCQNAQWFLQDIVISDWALPA